MSQPETQPCPQTTIVLAFIRLKLLHKKTIILVCCITDDVDSRFCIVSKSVTLVTNTVLFARRGSCPLWNQSRAIALIEKLQHSKRKVQRTIESMFYCVDTFKPLVYLS